MKIEQTMTPNRPLTMTHITTRWFTLLLLLLASPLAVADDDQVTRVFLFAGQSNMVGSDAHADRIDQFPLFVHAGQTQDDVLYSYLLGRRPDASEGWGPLRPLESFGPEVTFARMVKRRVPFPIAIIKSAVGGTTIAFDWNPHAPDEGLKLYPKTLELIRNSLEELDRRDVRYRLEAVIWHQGENDMLNRSINTDYERGLTEFIARLRKDLNAPELKWFIGEISEKGIWGMDHRGQLGAACVQQQAVVEADPLIWWVPTSHLSFEVMGSGQPHYHFGTQGQLQHGEAYAAAYLATIGKSPDVKKRAFEAGLPVANKGRVRLFVLAGQRNMEGEDAYACEIPDMDGFEPLAAAQGEILYRYSLGGGVKTSSDWEPLGPVDYLGVFGPELSFGATLRKSLDEQDAVAIVKFTHSGAQIPDWDPQGSVESHRNLYPRFLAFVRQATEDLRSRGYDCRLEGIFWHTGENDTYFHPYANSYAERIKRLIDATRRDLKQPALPWFISEQHKEAIWRNMEMVNSGLNAMAETDPHIAIVSTSHLPHARLHFGTQGTLLLGEELAKAYLGKE